MRTIHAAALGLGLAIAPFGATAQTATPGTTRAADDGWSAATTLAVGTGAVLGIVAINALTAGAMLAPMVGPAVSNAMGGGMLGPAALSPASRQALCRSIAILATAAAGAGLGYWIVSE